ncbi:MAG: GFA family protein [Candidatus Binataceae bacterium]
MATTYKGSCHCGAFQFEVTGYLTEVTDCNCSICGKSGYLHWYVTPEQVRLLTHKRMLSTYMWRGMTGGHLFCPVCGVAVVRMTVQFERPLSINARCLEGVDFTKIIVDHYDGKNLIP